MPRQIGFVILGLLLQVPVVLLLFRTLPLKVAGAIAGALFCALSVWILVLGLKDPTWRKGLAFWVNIPFLALFAVPIWIMSLTGTGQGIVHLDFGGTPTFFIPLRVLHHYARYFFTGLGVCALVDLVRFYLSQRAADLQGRS